MTTLDQTWYRDLDYISKVNIVNNSGNKYVLNGYSTYINDVVYRLNIGTYHIKDIPQAHPMAILNNGIEDKISYKGLLTKKISKNVSSSTADGDYDFYWGDITITVHSNFTQCSIYCYHHGYMGGENLLKFDAKKKDNDLDTIEYGIYNTHKSWAMLKTDGSVFTWGPTNYGGKSHIGFDSHLINVKKIYQNYEGFAMLREDGIVIPIADNNEIGNCYNNIISTNYDIFPLLTDIKNIYNTTNTFAALKQDNTVVFWGKTNDNIFSGYMDVSNNITDVIDITNNRYSYVILKHNGTIVNWGHTSHGGDSSSVANNLTNIKKVFSNEKCYAALKHDGSVVTWGNTTNGGNSTSVADKLVNIIDIFSTQHSFCALDKDYKIACSWGHSSYGGAIGSNINIDDLTNITNVYSGATFYAAEKNNNTLYIWGLNMGNGHIVQDVSSIAISEDSLAVLKTDGTVFHAGHSSHGGNPPAHITAQLTNVVKIYASKFSFTALKNDSSIVWWGRSGNYPGLNEPMYKAESNYPNLETVISDASLNVFDIFPGWFNNFIEKKDGTFYRINDFLDHNSGHFGISYDQKHKIGSKFNRYSRFHPSFRNGNIGALYNNADSITTSRYFNKYNISQQKKDFYRLNYSDASQNIFTDSFTDNVLKTSVKEFIKNEITNETNAILKNDKRKLFLKTLLRNNNKNSVILSATDINLDNVVSKKNIEIITNNFTLDLTTRNAEIGVFTELNKNEYIIIKSKQGRFIFYKAVDRTNKFYIVEYLDSLSNITFEKVTNCMNFNFTNNTGYFIKDDVFKIDQYSFKVGSLIDVTNQSTLNEIKIKKIFTNDGAFVCLKNNGFIDCWGKSTHGGTPPTDISNVKDIFSTPDTFTALLNNNNLITWGNTSGGTPIIKTNQKLKKQALLNKVNSLSGNINNVLNNNTKLTKNYNKNNDSVLTNINQIVDKKVLNFIDNFSQDLYNKIQSLKFSNNSINNNDLEPFQIFSNKKRHSFFDNLFLNKSEKNVIANSERIFLQNKILKEKTLVLENNNDIDATKTSSQITKDVGVYSNLSDLSDNVVVEIENNVKFKVTRTTDYLSVGKYIIEPVTGTIEVYGRHSGTISNTTEKLGLYEDDDEIYINDQHFFFGGFGTNGINNVTKDKYNSVVTAPDGIAYLDASGGVHTIATANYRGSSFTDSFYGLYACTGKNIDHTKDVVHLVANKESFAALTKNGEVFCLGHPNYCSMVGTYNWQNSVSFLNNDIIQIYSNYFFYVALKKNRDIFAWGSVPTDTNGVPQIMTYGSMSQTYILKNQKPPIISPIKNVHKVIMGYSACAVITFDRTLITFGVYSKGGDYLDPEFGIYGTRNPADGESVLTAPLTNVKKVIHTRAGFAALDFNGKVYVWGLPQYQSQGQTLDISLNSGVLDIEPFSNGFLARYQDSVKLYGQNLTSYQGKNFNLIENDVSKNCLMVSSLYSIAFLRKTDNMLFVCGSTSSGGGILTQSMYKYSDRSDIISNHQMRNVSKVYASRSGFAVIKTDGSAVAWGYNSTSEHNHIETTYGGDVNSHVKKLFTNGYAWCALKTDETLVSWTSDISNSAITGANFTDPDVGINSQRFGGNNFGGSRDNSYYDNTKLGFIKNVVPIRLSGFVALSNNNNEERAYIWGWSSIDTKGVTTQELTNLNNSSSESTLNVINSYNSSLAEFTSTENTKNNIVDNLLPYKRIIDVTVQTIDGNNKFVFNNDVSNNPITNTDVNYEFNLSHSSLTTHPFKIVSTPYSNDSIWKTMGTQGSKLSNYDVVLSNKYNIIKCATHGVGMGSLYNDPNIIVDISEGELVESLFDTTTKTTIGSFVSINYDQTISDTSMNIITFTNYEERSAIFDLINKVLAYKLNAIKTSRTALDLDNSNFAFSDPILYYTKAFIFDYNTTINLEVLNNENNFYYGNIINKNNKIKIQFDINSIFEIEKISENGSSNKYKLNFITGVFEFRTNALNFQLTNQFSVVNQNTQYDEATHYFVDNDIFFINDIEIKLVNNGFITSGNKINYKEIIITKNSNNTYLFNGKTIKPSFEYGLNYKIIDRSSNVINAPIFITKNVF